jgi:methyltransferase (TIGR00027 family)
MAAASRSALVVTLVRAHLTSAGVVDDPYAIRMLPPSWQRTATVMRLPGLRPLLLREPSQPYLAARTLVFDRFVQDALDDGIDQVVIVGAGYDSRAWRLARPDVTFYEIDQPATQASKRALAPEGGPRFVSSDVTDPGLRDQLLAAGFRPERLSAFALEGLAVYLEEQQVADLLKILVDLGHTGSRLAISFEQGFKRQPITRRVAKVVYRQTGETTYFRLPAEDAPGFLTKAGWTVDRALRAPELNREYLDRTPMPTPTRTDSHIVTATR